MTQAPLRMIFPSVDPSRFTLTPDSGSNMSAPVIPKVLTPCLAFSLALSVTGNLFHSLFQAQDTTNPHVPVNLYP
ncbi:hypothetical protein V6N13_129668 [Hibiscus sabdariffa]